jgi:pimeloyl-ACP methyl ester carboxylesterase
MQTNFIQALIIFECLINFASAQSGSLIQPENSRRHEQLNLIQSAACQSTGETCFLGIDPDVYQMPLIGESIKTKNGLICATKNWSPYPPELFTIEFMRQFWMQMTPADQARIEAAANYFVFTHWGSPAVPATDISEVAEPSFFAEEVFAYLACRTYRIEFEVPKTDFELIGWNPKYLSFNYPPDPLPLVPHKLRGWYIKGDGLKSNDEDEEKGKTILVAKVHPLVIFSSGFPYSMAYQQMVGGIDVGKQIRKTITYLVAKGYDVLYFDKRGHGYSEGIVEGMGEDIFRVIDQLDKGVIVEKGIPLHLTIITPEGKRLSGTDAARENLLGSGYNAKTKPIIFRGFSYGSSQLQKAMAMNYSDLPIEYHFKKDNSGNIVIDYERIPEGNRGYNFKGLIAISGFQGSVKYETIPYFLALDAGASIVGHNGGTLKSTVYQSMDKWPAFLGLYATNDFETADGAIDVYNNKLRGYKKLKMVTGYHFGLSSEEADSYFALETSKFASHVIFSKTNFQHHQTTTYANEVCNAEPLLMDPLTQTITGVPSKVIQNANRKVNDFIEKWIRKEQMNCCVGSAF